ncbi:MAG: branched-chain amino acid aminotransferase [Steroidobacteraceae bacterium]
MSTYDIDPGVPAAIENFKLPEPLGFGQAIAPVMFDAHWRDGEWQRGRLLPYGPIELLPGARALHYAELVFEGLKAYRVEGRGPNLFRPDANCRRFVHSASRLAMPPVPEALFFQGIGAVVRACTPVMPTRSGRSLYLRPFLFGTESGYMLRNSRDYRFMVIANPVEPYSSGAIKVAIERADVRAAVGGLGEVKAAANYAAALRASNAAVASGCPVALFLDANEHRYLQELSGMNLFAVVDGELHTPELDGAILPGITRDSLLTLARSLGYTAFERRMTLDELLEGIGSGRCNELFACGTAAIVSPITALMEGDGREYPLRQTDVVAKRLRESLLAIQERRAPDPFGWTQELPST